WAGRVYGSPLGRLLGRGGRIHDGMWWIAAFQSVYGPAPNVLGSLPLMPEWYMVIATLAGLSALGAAWQPLLLTLPVLAAAVGASLLQACVGAAGASFASKPRTRRARRGLGRSPPCCTACSRWRACSGGWSTGSRRGGGGGTWGRRCPGRARSPRRGPAGGRM